MSKGGRGIGGRCVCSIHLSTSPFPFPDPRDPTRSSCTVSAIGRLIRLPGKGTCKCGPVCPRERAFQVDVFGSVNTGVDMRVPRVHLGAPSRSGCALPHGRVFVLYMHGVREGVWGPSGIQVCAWMCTYACVRAGDRRVGRTCVSAAECSSAEGSGAGTQEAGAGLDVSGP